MVSNFAVPNIFTDEKEVVPGTGFEPAWFFDRLILSQLRLPFRHPGMKPADSVGTGRFSHKIIDIAGVVQSDCGKFSDFPADSAGGGGNPVAIPPETGETPRRNRGRWSTRAGRQSP